MACIARAHTLTPALLLLALAFSVVFGSQPAQAVDEKAPPPRTLPAPIEGPSPRSLDGFYPTARFQMQGVASCASMACHNNQSAPGIAGSEYTTWIAKDKHAGAYLVLLSERSRYIEKNLSRLKDITQAHPEKNPVCLKCHAHPHAKPSA